MELYIDEEFKGLLPDLADSERQELEKQILRDGVLNPIIVWNGTIVDGHNRYMICKLNGITEFPVKEMEFESRDDAIEWILQHQLGRRNLNDFQRSKIALRYEDIINKKAKERQAEYFGNQYKKVDYGSKDPKSKNDSHYTRNEIAKIADTSPATVMRTKFILANGSEEQIARAERGGREEDGRSNSIRAIVDEIKREKEVSSDVNGSIGNTATRGPKRILSAPIEDLDNNLHGIGRDMEYTGEDLMNDLETNGQILLDNLCTTLSLHNSLFEDISIKKMVNAYFKKLAEKISRIMEEEYEGKNEGVQV